MSDLSASLQTTSQDRTITSPNRQYWTPKRILRSSVSVIALALCIIFIVVGLILVFGEMPAEDRAKLWIEVGKSLLYLGTTVIAASVITQFVKSFSRSKKADSALHDFRVEFLNNMEEIYSTVKKTRRALRADGLSTKYYAPEGTLSPTQLSCYFLQMDALNGAQLDLERLSTQLGHFPDAFTGSAKLVNSINIMEKYLRSILDEYESNASTLKTTPEKVLFARLTRLQDLTGPYEGSEFRSYFTKQHDDALGLVRGELLPLRVVLKATIAE
jgi:fumarate reductase subunit D